MMMTWTREKRKALGKERHLRAVVPPNKLAIFTGLLPNFTILLAYTSKSLIQAEHTFLSIFVTLLKILMMVSVV